MNTLASKSLKKQLGRQKEAIVIRCNICQRFEPCTGTDDRINKTQMMCNKCLKRASYFYNDNNDDDDDKHIVTGKKKENDKMTKLKNDDAVVELHDWG